VKIEKRATSKEWQAFENIKASLSENHFITIPMSPGEWYLNAELRDSSLAKYRLREDWKKYHSHLALLGLSYDQYLDSCQRRLALYNPEILAKEILSVQPMTDLYTNMVSKYHGDSE